MSNASKTSGLSAIVAMKCPRCRKGKLFCHPTSYNFNTLFQMPDLCEECKQRIEPEPGFYYGAMYINYAFSVVLLAFCIGILYAVYHFNSYIVLGTYVGGLVVMGPWMFRYSRVLYMNIFVRYDEKIANQLTGIQK